MGLGPFPEVWANALASAKSEKANENPQAILSHTNSLPKGLPIRRDGVEIRQSNGK